MEKEKSENQEMDKIKDELALKEGYKSWISMEFDMNGTSIRLMYEKLVFEYNHQKTIANKRRIVSLEKEVEIWKNGSNDFERMSRQNALAAETFKEEVQRLKLKAHTMINAIRWALGYSDFEKPKDEKKPFWWRPQLREMSGLEEKELLYWRKENINA